MLDVHRLRVFSAVVASGSVAAAATNLGYTPSAISQHLAALQRETGLALLERVGRGLRPTPAGLSIAAQAQEVLSRLSEAEAVVTALRAEQTGVLRLTYMSSAGTTWLPEIARRLAEAHPEVALDLALLEDGVPAVEGRHDVQLLVGDRDAPPAGAGYVTHRLIDDPYHVVLATTHPLAGRDEIELAELGDDRWIDNEARPGWCRANLLRTCAAAGVVPTFHVQAHDYAMAVAFVGAGLGISVMPALGASHLPPGVVSIPVVRPAPTRTIYVVVRQAVADSSPVRVVLGTLRTMAGADRA
ncbi:LysR family transcriptional regulator [Frigoribacterium sp. 2-23]|uniref:LysR family transcriptional regulator n=1 Tax=Frigoribacterium sp. 2-23 TaxID=3415006 RepID=UPI003C6F3E51